MNFLGPGLQRNMRIYAAYSSTTGKGNQRNRFGIRTFFKHGSECILHLHMPICHNANKYILPEWNSMPCSNASWIHLPSFFWAPNGISASRGHSGSKLKCSLPVLCHHSCRTSMPSLGAKTPHLHELLALCCSCLFPLCFLMETKRWSLLPRGIINLCLQRGGGEHLQRPFHL